MEFPVELLPILRELVAGEQSFSCDSALCVELERFHLGPLAYFRSRGKLPAPWRQRFNEQFRKQAGNALRQQFAFGQLTAMLEENRIRFTPIKGVDLAFRVYPVPGLRPFCDWDIWIHPDDCGRIRDILKLDGWNCELEAIADHHFAVRRKNGFCLEPHFTLPNFNGIPVRELWKECIPIREGACRHVLSPELNLLLLYRHNNIDFFRKSNLPKLLIDFYFLLKFSRINWEKHARLCRNFCFGSPELLFQAFPEFFPEVPRVAEESCVEAACALRSILLTPVHFETYELIMNARHRFSREWWKTRLRCLRPDNVRLKYRKQKQDGSFMLFYCRDFLRKIYSVLPLRFQSHSAEFVEFKNKLEKIESYVVSNHSRQK